MAESEMIKNADADPEGIDSKHDFARVLTSLRSQAGLSVRQVAERAQALGAHSTIGDWFAGRGMPSSSSRALLVRVLQACGVTEPAVLRTWLLAWQRVRRLPGPRQAGREPYRGLASFGGDDAEWFFGRDDDTSRLVSSIEALGAAGGGVQLVVGPSGAGKSSLLGAGLVPAVRGGALPGSELWPIAVFSPGADPVGELARQLADLVGADAGELAGRLRADPDACAGYARRAAGDAQSRLLLVIDQFEELFAECKSPSDRHAFIQALFAAADPVRGRTIAVVALRADFYSRALRHPQLAAVAGTHQLPLGPMNQSELRQAIEKPARKARVDLEPGLADLVLHDIAPTNLRHDDGVAHEAGALPLLSHALYATWHQGKGKRLTIADYRQVGGVGGAIAATAESVYGSLSPQLQPLARRLLLSLVQVSHDAADIRRRVTYAELASDSTDPGILDQILNQFINQRLLTADVDTVQIGHEALLTAWPRLRQWLEEDRSSLVISRQLTEAANTWRHDGRDPSAVYRGTRLAMAQEWARERHDLAPAVAEFLAASHKEERRRARLAVQVIAALTVLAVVAAGLAAYGFQQREAANDQRQEAINQRNQAISRLIALRANKLRNTDLSVAMQLSLAAYRVAPTVEARSALLDSSTTPSVTRIRAFSAPAQAVAFSPDRRILAAGSVDQTVRLWDLSDPNRPTLIGEPLTGPNLGVFAVAFSPDGKTLAAGSADGKIHRWDISTPARARPLSPLTGPRATVYSLAFSPNGRFLAAGSADKTVRIWETGDASSPTPTATLRGPSGSVHVVTFSPDGRTMAAGSADTTTRLWSLAHPETPIPLGTPLAGPRATVYSLAFSPDGRTLAVGSADSTTRLWDVSNPADAVAGPSLTGPTSWINALAFSPDGQSLAAGSSDNAVTIWNTTDWRVATRLPHPSSVTGVAFGRDRSSLVSSAMDGAIRLWTAPGPITHGATSSILSIAISADGRTMAEASRDQSLRLWDLADRRHPTLLGKPLSSTDRRHPFAATTALSRDGRILVVGTRTGAVELWDLDDRTQPKPIGRPLFGLTGIVQSIAFNPTDHLLAAGGDDGTVRIWDVSEPRNPTLLSVLGSTGTVILFLAFSPSAPILAVAGTGNRLHLWDLADPAKPKRLTPPLVAASNDINSAAFSPDGRTLALGSTDRSIHLWDLTDPRKPTRLAQPLTGPSSKVFWVTFSPNGQRLAAAVTDGTIWLWDTTQIDRPALYATLDASSPGAYTVTFTPDSQALAAGGADATTRVWDPDPERVTAWICATTGDRITQEEWNQHVTGVDFEDPC